MGFLFALGKRIGFATVAGMAVAFALFLALALGPARGAPPPRAAAPLQLSKLDVPLKTLTTPTPSVVSYTFTSSSGPFCLQGLAITVGPSAPVYPGDVGDVFFHLNRIDGNGLSNANLKLVDGASGGFSPLDIVVSYGSQICANQSVEFEAVRYPGNNDNGTEIHLWGQAIILTAQGNTITVN